MNWPEDFVDKVICGDCLEIMKQLPGACIDLIQADPPYNFEHNSDYSKYSWFSKAKKDYLKRIQTSFGHSFEPEVYLEASLRIMKKYNAYWWCSKNLVHRYTNWAEGKKFSFNILAWHKLNPAPLWYCHYLPDTEYCIFMNEKGAYFNSDLGDWRKYRRFYLSFKGEIDQGHPTVKPLFIIQTQIEISSKPNSIVLDPFLGSGTTAVAAKLLKRHFIGIDIKESYCEISREKLAQEVL